MPEFAVLAPMMRGAVAARFAPWIAVLWRDHRAIVSARVAIVMNGTIIASLPAPVFSAGFPPGRKTAPARHRVPGNPT